MEALGWAYLPPSAEATPRGADWRLSPSWPLPDPLSPSASQATIEAIGGQPCHLAPA